MRYIIISTKIIYLLFFLISKTLANEVVPVDIVADEMQWNDNNKIAYAIGNAIATQGEKKISADKLIVHLDKGEDNNEIILIEAEGNVIFNNEKEVATGKIAKYNFIENNIIIENTVTLKKDDNIMKGELLIMDLNTGVSQISSNSDTNKVKMRFIPKKVQKDE
ncbi:MAG: LptA/OstA family protein [Alphaproteobacteria bacterium]|nr:LptA/OstA family protein [Alphaproteobacteria bacterium]